MSYQVERFTDGEWANLDGLRFATAEEASRYAGNAPGSPRRVKEIEEAPNYHWDGKLVPGARPAPPVTPATWEQYVGGLGAHPGGINWRERVAADIYNRAFQLGDLQRSDDFYWAREFAKAFATTWPHTEVKLVTHVTK